jgi:hypothetical protein
MGKWERKGRMRTEKRRFEVKRVNKCERAKNKSKKGYEE